MPRSVGAARSDDDDEEEEEEEEEEVVVVVVVVVVAAAAIAPLQAVPSASAPAAPPAPASSSSQKVLSGKPMSSTLCIAKGAPACAKRAATGERSVPPNAAKNEASSPMPSPPTCSVHGRQP